MFKILDSNSLSSTKSELDLFVVPPTQVAVEKSQWREINLRNACTNDGPYEFHIPPDPQMLDLSKNYLLMELKIKNEDDTNIPGDANIAPINLLGKTFIEKVKLSLNGNEIYDSGTKYAYRAFLETELNYGPDAKSGILQAAGYIKDVKPIDEVTNAGFVARKQMSANSRTIQIMAPIHCDLFQQNKFLLNQVEVRLTLYRNRDRFCLMAFGDNIGNPKINVVTMKWYVKMMDINKSLGLALEKTMMEYTAKYPVRRVEIKSLHVGEGRRESPENAIFSGQIPRRIVLGCVNFEAYNGSYSASPFNFKPFNIKELSIVAGGITYPSKPLNPNFPGNQYARSFIQFFEGIGIAGDNKSNGITYESYKDGGHTLFAFDLSPDENDGSHWDLIKDGTTAVNIKFGTVIPQGGVEIIVYAEFDNLITMDRNRETFIDYKLS